MGYVLMKCVHCDECPFMVEDCKGRYLEDRPNIIGDRLLSHHKKLTLQFYHWCMLINRKVLFTQAWEDL